MRGKRRGKRKKTSNGELERRLVEETLRGAAAMKVTEARGARGGEEG